MVLLSKREVNLSITTGPVGVFFSIDVVNPSVTTGPVWFCSVQVW